MQVEPQVEVRAGRHLLGDRAQRGVEAGLLQHVRMEVEDGLAELPHGLGQRRVRPGERGVGQHLARLLQVVARGEQVLDGVVVQRLGQRAALALLRLERVREQGGALLGQPLDGGRAAGQQQREQDAADADPGQVAGLREDEARRVGLAGGRVEGGLQDVRRRRRPRSRRW